MEKACLDHLDNGTPTQLLLIMHRDGVTRSGKIRGAIAQRLLTDGFNLFIDLVHMRIQVGRSCEDPLDVPKELVKVRGQPLSVLVKLLHRPGEFLRPCDIGTMKPYNDSHFISANIAQYTMRLRKYLFGETAENAHFVLTVRHPYRVAFNAEVSFCLIEPVTEERRSQGQEIELPCPRPRDGPPVDWCRSTLDVS